MPRLLALATLVLLATPLAAQDPTGNASQPPVAFGAQGLVFSAPDSFTYLALRFRMQQWMVLGTDDDEPGIARTQLAVRRARLRLESVVLDPRLKVNIQLSFARGDLDFEASGFPNVLRDAYVTWQATPRLSFVAGQAKLPGNRQRTISSGEQEFPDRSIVNAAFTVDRDVGAWVHYSARDAALPYALRAAITGGEGRNAPAGDAGLAYTGRIELYPLGNFSARGESYEGDLAREASPKLALGVAFSHNEQAQRVGGQLGRALGAPRDMQAAFADVTFKYRGVSASAELARRTARDPITMVDSTTRAVLAGGGVNVQASYVTRGLWAPAVRFSLVEPEGALAGVYERQRQMSFGLSRYLNGHRVKVQAEVMRDDWTDLATQAKRGGWALRTSLEVGI